MKNSWILVDECGCNESMWEEKSSLYWVGGNAYAITWYRSVSGQEEQTRIIAFINGQENALDRFDLERALYMI